MSRDKMSPNVSSDFRTFSVSLSSSASLKVLAVSQAFIELGLEPFHTVAILGHNDPCWHVRWWDDHDIDYALQWRRPWMMLAMVKFFIHPEWNIRWQSRWKRCWHCWWWFWHCWEWRWHCWWWCWHCWWWCCHCWWWCWHCWEICWCFSFLAATWLRCTLVVLQRASTRQTGGKIYLPDWPDIYLPD